MTQAYADAFRQKVAQRRNEQVNACNLDYWKAELAKALRPRTPAGGTDTQADLNWNRDYGGYVLQVVAGRGTLTGNFQSWTYAGTGTKNERVTCSGGLDPGVVITKAGNARGTMRCEARWGTNVWICEGPTSFAASHCDSCYAGGCA